MYNNRNFIIGHIKQPMCLHNLQALVGQCRGIKRYLLPHAPIWVIEALRQSYIFQLTAFFAAERTAARRNNQALDFFLRTAAQRLENSAVLTVHRSQAYTVLTHSLHNNAAGSNKRFLIGQRNVLAAGNSSQRRAQAGIAYHRTKHRIRSLVGSSSQKTFLPG